MLSCRPNFEIKLLPAHYTEKPQDDDLYRIFGGLLNQCVRFMRQWIRCFSLTHKGFIINLARTYLKSKSLKIGTWVTGIKNGCRPDTLAFFLLCVITGTHCFIHTKVGIWTTLFEEPDSHQALIQSCNLHLGYLGNGIYIEFVPQTEIVSFQIFWVPEPVDINMDAKPVAIGTLSFDEQETLNKLLSTGITQCSAALSTSAATDVKLQIPTSAEVNDTDIDTLLQSAQQISNIDMATPEHVVPCSQNAHVKLPPKVKDPNISSSVY